MTSFTPINDDHAVTSVLFGIQLDEFVEPTTIEMLRRTNPWAESLPAVTTLSSVDINQGGQNYPVPAIQFAIVRPDSRPLWSLKFSGYDLVVECTVYSRWAEVWKTASTLIEQAFEQIRLRQKNVNIVDFRLQVTDQFTTEDEHYDLAQLFNRESLYLSPMVFDGGRVWNNGIGWFEQDDDLHLADTVAVTAQGQVNGLSVSAPYIFTLQHFSRVMTNGDARPEIDRLDGLISKLHLRNKSVVYEMLSHMMRDRIGLTV